MNDAARGALSFFSLGISNSFTKPDEPTFSKTEIMDTSAEVGANRERGKAMMEEALQLQKEAAEEKKAEMQKSFFVGQSLQESTRSAADAMKFAGQQFAMREEVGLNDLRTANGLPPPVMDVNDGWDNFASNLKKKGQSDEGQFSAVGDVLSGRLNDRIEQGIKKVKGLSDGTSGKNVTREVLDALG